MTVVLTVRDDFERTIWSLIDGPEARSGVAAAKRRVGSGTDPPGLDRDHSHS